MTPQLNPLHDPLQLYTITEAVRFLGRSRRSIYRDIDAGRIRTVKLGRSTRIPKIELERYIRENLR